MIWLHGPLVWLVLLDVAFWTQLPLQLPLRCAFPSPFAYTHTHTHTRFTGYTHTLGFLDSFGSHLWLDYLWLVGLDTRLATTHTHTHTYIHHTHTPYTYAPLPIHYPPLHLDLPHTPCGPHTRFLGTPSFAPHTLYVCWFHTLDLVGSTLHTHVVGWMPLAPGAGYTPFGF